MTGGSERATRHDTRRASVQVPVPRGAVPRTGWWAARGPTQWLTWSIGLSPRRTSRYSRVPESTIDDGRAGGNLAPPSVDLGL